MRKDFCSAPNSPIHFDKIECKGNLEECETEAAGDDKKNTDDTIIHCYDEELEAAEFIFKFASTAKDDPSFDTDDGYVAGRVMIKHRHDNNWSNVSVQVENGSTCFPE